MGNAMRERDANVAPQTNVAASKQPITNYAAAQRFQDVVEDFTAADLARAAHRTKAAAKGWKDGSRAPDVASTINMARSLSAVQQWVAEECDMGSRAAQAQSVEGVMQQLYALAATNGAEAVRARALIARLMGPAPASGDADVTDLFAGRR